jgi:type II secretory pathway component PulJ
MNVSLQMRVNCEMRCRPNGRWNRAVGFTLAETMVTTAVFTLVMGSMLSLYVFSSKAISGTTVQLQLNTQAQVVNLMVNEIKSSRLTRVMTYNGTNMSSIAMGQAQKGNALSLSVPDGAFGTTNMLPVYYWIESNGYLYRASGGIMKRKLWMTCITNTFVFSLQDYKGNIASNLLGKSYIDINLYCYDNNTRNFLQSLNLLCGAQQRN